MAMSLTQPDLTINSPGFVGTGYTPHIYGDQCGCNHLGYDYDE